MGDSLPASGVVRVLPYDGAWPSLFRAEAGRIRSALGELALSIDHIGSTAVPGLAARPVIDIAVPVAHLEPEAPYRDPLQRIGYVYGVQDEETLELRRHFRLCSSDTWVADVYVVLAGSREEQRLVAFRDVLRSDPMTATAYAVVKRALAARFPSDPSLYTLAKSAFITEVLGRVLPPR